MSTPYTANDPVHAIVGWSSEELYYLSDGRVIPRAVWDAPREGWDEVPGLTKDEAAGLVPVFEAATACVTALGYKLIDPAFCSSHANEDGSAITEDQFNLIVERLRVRGFAVENFQLVDGVFWVNRINKQELLDSGEEQA